MSTTVEKTEVDVKEILEKLRELKSEVEKIKQVVKTEEVKELYELLDKITTLAGEDSLGVTTLIKSIWYIGVNPGQLIVYIHLPGNLSYTEYINGSTIDLIEFYEKMKNKIIFDKQVYTKVLELLKKVIASGIFDKINELEMKISHMTEVCGDPDDDDW